MCARFEQKGCPIRPTDFATVLLPDGPALLRWGVPVAWESRPLINARAETLADRPTFRRLLCRRAIIPATAWWEWRDRHRYRLGLAEGGRLAFAGLFDGDHFTLITRAAHALLAGVHDRMPAVLAPAAEADWLAGATDMVGLLAEPGLEYRVQSDEPPPRQGDLF
jgi:putative SOS response-associated peptidase YedK